MVGVAGVVLWLGYAVFSYGWSQVRHCNAGFISMLNPFGPQPKCNPDKGGASSNALSTAISNAQTITANPSGYTAAQKQAAAQQLANAGSQSGL